MRPQADMRTEPLEMICGMCGQHFNPDDHVACRACPLSAGCQLVCCPNCGFEAVNPQRSTLVRQTLKVSESLRTWISSRR